MPVTLPGAIGPPAHPAPRVARARRARSLESGAWDGRCASHCCPTGASRTAAARASTCGRCPGSWPASATGSRCSADSPIPSWTTASRSPRCRAWTSIASPTRSARPGRRSSATGSTSSSGRPCAPPGSPSRSPSACGPRGSCSPAAAEFDVVHDNQSLGWGLLRLTRAGIPTVATVHHPIAIDRQLELAAAPSLRRRLTLRRWYGFTGMQARVAGRLDGVTTVSENSRRDIAAHMGRAGGRRGGHPGRHRPGRVHSPTGRAAAGPRLRPGDHQRRRRAQGAGAPAGGAGEAAHRAPGRG